ncbi:hypothetical protein L6R53_08235 [Myxococcota bacterium]|nr:hypothetical protein [Myxococcota bacterium]
MWWVLAILQSARGAPARVEQVALELLRPDGQSFALHELERPQGGEQVVIPDGDRAWQVALARKEYDGRLEICADLSSWGADGQRQGLAHSCVVLPGRDSPAATTLTRTDHVHLRLTVRRGP